MQRPWMPLYVADFILDTLDLTTEQIGCYFLMLLLCWRRDDAALPNDMKWLKRAFGGMAAPMHGHTFNRLIPPLLKRYFELGADNKWRNRRLCRERDKAAKMSTNQSQNASKRWHGTRNINRLAYATGMPSQSQRIERGFSVEAETESEKKALDRLRLLK